MHIKDFTDTTNLVVELRYQDLRDAERDGLLTKTQADTLWRRWSRDAMTTHSTQPLERTAAPAAGPAFGFVNVLYYFGGLVAIGAMSLFMTLGFQAVGPVALLAIGVAYLIACLKVADYFKARGLRVPAGLLATLAVCLVSLVAWSAQSVAGLWPPGGPDSFSSYHTRIDWRWLTLEFVTLAAGVVMLWRYRLPFMVMPLAVTLWYMSMDVANALLMDHGWEWEFTRDVSLVFGIGTVALALWVDVRSRLSRTAEWRQDFAFWLYIFGTTMFWSGLSLSDSGSPWGKVIYALINVVMVLLGAAIGRRVFTVFGALGVALYLGYLSHQVFRDSLLFPLALTLLGLGVVALGVWWQRHEVAIAARLARYVPAGLQPRN
ncbi:DUF2157 domain-containing protein [Rhodoferax saidenbachensis]|uniref:DUF2157 domain-containing protein n=1 Tax=Rhodoferax saidenbachensis TaxID=1484693 RepID=A0ABU1ZS19_9BURK|nr:DUF2157 domain-containing protein [Rhodoferax saidenbachensis]MDR7307660.1 hypothetical protein [Rhodoferax saidenbachensis]